MLSFATLGPAGSNHDWVARKYLEFHGLDDAAVVLFADFDAAIESMLRGQSDHVIQVAVHASVATTLARYRNRAHVIDTFVSPSQSMAVLTRVEVKQPVSLGLQLATRDYVDSSRWATLVPEATTIDVMHGLLDARYDSGITLARFVEEYPQRLRMDEAIGTVVDPWLVYGTQAMCADSVLAWKDSPAGAHFRRDENQ